MSTKRSAAATAASNHWAKKPKSGDGVVAQNGEQAVPAFEVQDARDEAKSETELPIEVIEVLDKDEHTSPIRLLRNPSIAAQDDFKFNKDTVKLTSFLNVKDLKETFQFNFNVDLSFFLPLLHREFVSSKKPITFITGAPLLDPNYEDTEAILKNYNIREVVASLPYAFGTHHTKMMINFYEDSSVEIIIMTCNLTQLDIGAMTQMLWTSGRLPESHHSSAAQPRFKKDLFDYLATYKVSILNTLVERLRDHDFSSVDIELVSSSPGQYELDKISDGNEAYGYGKLRQILRRNNLLVGGDSNKRFNILSQVSSISGALSSTQGRSSSVFTHLICPLLFSGKSQFQVLEPGRSSCALHQSTFNYTPSIVYPTVREIAGSTVGWGSGQAIHFKYTGYNHPQFVQNIKPYLKRWNSSKQDGITGREHVPPHVKFLMCDNGDKWATLRFVLMGSHNLSKQAWGAPVSKSSSNKYKVSSYELSVMIIPKKNETLIPSYGSDNIDGSENSVPVRLPFMLPPKEYSADDDPWSMHVSHGDIKDIFGQMYNI